MTFEALQKETSVIEVLIKLRSRLGVDAFVLADHWDCDLCAVGIASPQNQGVLAYISTFKERPGEYSYQLELPPHPNSESPYLDLGGEEHVSFEKLVAVISAHLQLAE